MVNILTHPFIPSGEGTTLLFLKRVLSPPWRGEGWVESFRYKFF
jgi:hypothetical protein